MVNPEDLVGKQILTKCDKCFENNVVQWFDSEAQELVSSINGGTLPLSSFQERKGPPIDRNKCLCSEVVTQGLVIIHVNILSMHKHKCIQGLAPCLPLLASSRVCFLNSF